MKEDIATYRGDSITSPENCSNAKGVCHTLSTDSRNYAVICIQGGGETSLNSNGSGWIEGDAYTVNTVDRHAICYPQITGALCANSHPGSYTGQDAFNDMLPVIKVEKERKYIVRRLTPIECCRLQGFPDWWVDGAEGSDSAIYKMWGNGIALPCAADVIGRLAKELDKSE